MLSGVDPCCLWIVCATCDVCLSMPACLSVRATSACVICCVRALSFRNQNKEVVVRCLVCCVCVSVCVVSFALFRASIGSVCVWREGVERGGHEVRAVDGGITGRNRTKRASLCVLSPQTRHGVHFELPALFSRLSSLPGTCAWLLHTVIHAIRT